MNNPLISIIIPYFNTANYIEEILDGVANQTYQNIEIIVIDDGSTDDTLEVLYIYQNKMPKLKIISQKNTYYVIARQNAIAHAKGKYLVCLDSDDKLHPTYVEKCYQLAEMKNLDIVYSDAQYFDATDGRWDLPDFKLYDFLHCNCIYVTAMIRKSAFDRVGGFDTSLTHFEDWDLFISIIKNREKDEVVGKMSEVLFFIEKDRIIHLLPIERTTKNYLIMH